MLNVRIIKGGCRGREAAKFGLVGFKANVFLHEEISIHKNNEKSRVKEICY